MSPQSFMTKRSLFHFFLSQFLKVLFKFFVRSALRASNAASGHRVVSATGLENVLNGGGHGCFGGCLKRSLVSPTFKRLIVSGHRLP